MSVKVSVVVPVFNASTTISDLFLDLEAQTFEAFEVVFVNDGSTDNSLEILNELASRQHLKTRVVSQPNGGVSTARNAGIRASSGEYIVFVDADDRISPIYLSTLYNCVIEAESDIAIAKFVTDEEKLDESSSSFYPMEKVAFLRQFLYEPRKRFAIVTLMFKREIILLNHIYFAEGYAYGEDYHFIWRLLSTIKTVACTDTGVYLYKYSPSSASARFDERRFHAYELMLMLVPFIREKIPGFASEFERYGPSRTMWSIAWQAATMLDWKSFSLLIESHPVLIELRKLRGFPDLRVQLSRAVLLLSPRLFYWVLIPLRTRLISRSRSRRK